MCLLVIVGTRASAAGGPSCSALAERLLATDPRDAAALFRLGRECETQKCFGLAGTVYERLLKLPEKEVPAKDRCDAEFRLARIEMGREQYDRAFALLRRALSRCPEHAEARALLDRSEDAGTRAQLAHVEEGDASLGKATPLEKASAKYLEEAIGHYEKALDLTPEAATRSAFLPRSEVLSKLARCRDLLDDLRFKEEYLPRTRGIRPCPICATSERKGFNPCDACKGTGTVMGQRRVGRVIILGPVTCRVCHGHGFRGCDCAALGFVWDAITPAEKKALEELVDKLRQPELFANKSAEVAIRGVEKELLAVKEGATLNLLRAMTPDFALSAGMRKAIGTVPPTATALSGASFDWVALGKDPRARFNFLINYACEYADYLQPFDMLRNSKGPDARTFPLAVGWKGPVLTPEQLSAFPDETKTGWIAIQGNFVKCRLPGKDDPAAALEVTGEAEHTIQFVAWASAATSRLEALSAGGWKKAVDPLVASYPFDIVPRIADIPKDHTVRFVGRFLRDRFGYPRNWFEVWDFEVGLSRSQEGMLRALSAPINEIAFTNMRVKEVCEVLRDWFDVEIRLDGVPDATPITAKALGCPTGLLVDAISRRALGAEWYWREGQVVICRAGASPAPRETAPVLARLRTPPHFVAKSSSVSASPGGAGDRPDDSAPESVPEDPAALKRSLSDALEVMDFDLADRCLGCLLAVAKEDRERTLFERFRAKVAIYRELAGPTPVSRLVGAGDLWEIVYRKPSGDRVQRTVILERPDGEGGKLKVQEGYGASFSIDAVRVEKRTRISGSEWRRKKEAELEGAVAECDGVPADVRVMRLFILANLAKSNRLPGGTDLLRRAVEAAEFEAFARDAYPARAEALIALWRKATARKAPERPPEKPPVVEVVRAPEPPEPEARREPKAEPSAGAPGSAATTKGEYADLLARARELVAQGNACIPRALPGQDGAEEWARKGLASFEQAREAATSCLEARPGDEDAKRLQRVIQQRILDLNKVTGW